MLIKRGLLSNFSVIIISDPVLNIALYKGMDKDKIPPSL